MRYKLLGGSGPRVSELCLGTMTFGEDWGWGASKEECRKIFDAFTKENGNFIDTAINYTNGTAENIAGELIASDRSRFVVATKYTLSRRSDDPNGGGNHRKNLVESLNLSLKRLKTEYIDLYYVHVWDFTTPIEEIMRALDDQVRAGKILHIGISDTPAWIVAQANMLARERGWTQISAYQGQYSLASRHAERDIFGVCNHWDMAYCAWAILGGGVLTGKYAKATPEPKRFQTTGNLPSERNIALGGEVEKIALDMGRSPSQIAIAWVLSQRTRANIIPIIGVRSLAQLQDNLGALGVPFTGDQLKRLDDLSRIELGFPHDFVAQPFVKQLVHGSTFENLDNHHARK